MAAPMRQIFRNVYQRKYHVADFNPSCILSFYRRRLNNSSMSSLVSRPMHQERVQTSAKLTNVLPASRDCISDRNSPRSFPRVTVASNSIKRCYSSRQGRRESSGNVSLALGIGGFALCSASLAFSFWREDNKETIEKMIARAMIAERENRLADADQFYHQATVMCEKEKNSQALLYTYDQMANFNMRHGRLMKAENLFKDTLRLLLTSGIPKEDPGVVEISLKLSRIYERMGRNEEADIGFKWCIETSEQLLKDTPDDSTQECHDKIMNLKSLLGMCLDSYARFLGATNRLADSEKLYKKALEICEGDLKVDGTPHPQTIILLNDLGTICDMRGHYDEAIGYVSRALELAEKGSPEVLPTILCNLASIKMHKGLKDDARDLYKRALKLAEKQGDREATIIIQANLLKVS